MNTKPEVFEISRNHLASEQVSERKRRQLPSVCGVESRNRQFLVEDVFPDLRENGFTAAIVIGLKSVQPGTEIYLRIAPGLRNRDIEGFLSDLLLRIKSEAAADPDGVGEYEREMGSSVM